MRTTWRRPRFASIANKHAVARLPDRILEAVLVSSRAENLAAGLRAIRRPGTGVNAILPAVSIRSAASFPRCHSRSWERQA